MVLDATCQCSCPYFFSLLDKPSDDVESPRKRRKTSVEGDQSTDFNAYSTKLLDDVLRNDVGEYSESNFTTILSEFYFTR